MSYSTLVKVAAGGAVLVTGAYTFTQWKIQESLKGGAWYSESLRLLRSHPGTVELLGQPIVDGSLDLSKPAENFCSGTLAQFRVPVQGPKASGYLYLWASRSSSVWTVDRLELELAADRQRRLLVYSGDGGDCDGPAEIS